MRFLIPDFISDRRPLMVHVLGGGSAITVSLSMRKGGLSFGHHMTPDRARDMARALNLLADDADLAEIAADVELAAEVAA